MSITTALKLTAAVFAGLVIVAATPLVDAESGWKHTLGDIVWTGIFVTAAVLVALGVTFVVARVRVSSPQRD